MDGSISQATRLPLQLLLVNFSFSLVGLNGLISGPTLYSLVQQIQRHRAAVQDLT
jgi:hypothetical protein